MIPRPFEVIFLTDSPVIVATMATNRREAYERTQRVERATFTTPTAIRPIKRFERIFKNGTT